MLSWPPPGVSTCPVVLLLALLQDPRQNFRAAALVKTKIILLPSLGGGALSGVKLGSQPSTLERDLGPQGIASSPDSVASGKGLSQDPSGSLPQS